jgi:hypothetical protein
MPATTVELHFGDGEYLFDLKLPQMAELQEKRGAGIFALYGRVMAGRFLLEGGDVIGHPHLGQAHDEDLFETIRLGLIGGGRGLVNDAEVVVTPLLARRLVERYCHPAPLMDSWAIASTVLGAKIVGIPEKKAEPAKVPAKPSRRQKASTTKGQSPTA